MACPVCGEPLVIEECPACGETFARSDKLTEKEIARAPYLMLGCLVLCALFPILLIVVLAVWDHYFA